MIGIGSAGLSLAGIAQTPSDSKTFIRGAEASAVVTADEAAGTEGKAGEPTTVNLGGGGPAEAESGGGEAAHIQQLRQQMKELQEKLAEQQKQLQDVMASKMEEQAKTVAVLSAQTAVSATSASLAQVTAALLSALSEAGGSSAGSSVDTTA